MFKSKKLIFLALIVFIVLTPLVLAGNYGEGTYGSGCYGEDCPIVPTPTPSPGGGSGGGCSYNWQCTNWYPLECPALGIQERICINKGTCTGTTGMPELNKTCIYQHKEPLFDIFLTIPREYKKVFSGEEIKANVKLENYGNIELLDAFMTYWIINENNTLVTEIKDTRAVTTGKEFEIEMKIPELAAKGTYRLYAQITYNEDKTAVAGESFECEGERLEFPAMPKEVIKIVQTIFLIIGLIALLFAAFLIIKLLKKHKNIRKHDEYKAKIKENLKKIRAKSYLKVLAGFMLIGILFIGKKSLTGFSISNKIIENSNLTFFIFALIAGICGALAIIFKKEIVRSIEYKKRNKHHKNSLKGLISKKVYSEEGNFIGKVNEVLLRENKIDSLRIKLDKKQKFKIKGIIIKYKDIKAVGHIVLIDEKSLGKLNI